MKRLALLLLFGFAALLSGCGTLSETVQQRIAIAEQCRQVLDGSYRPQWEIPDQLLARRLGSLSSCSPLGSSSDKANGDFVALCAFDEIDINHRLRKQEEGKTQAEIVRVSIAWSKLKMAMDELRKSLTKVDEFIQSAINHCKKRQKAAYCLVAERDLRSMLPTQGDHLLERLTQVRNQTAELRVALAAIAPVLTQAAKNDIAIWEANFKAQLAKLERAAGGDTRLLIEDSVRNHALRYSARRSLDLLHKSLRPIDAALNRTDDKAYGVISAGNFLFGHNIQSAVNESFEGIQESYRRRFAAERNQHLVKGFLVEMGRAACEDIEKKTEFSMLTELVDTMFISQIDGAINKMPESSSDGDNTLAGTSDTAAMPKKPLALDALIRASSPQATPIASVPPTATATTVPADVYMVHEWAARQLLLKRLLQQNNKAGNGIKSNEMPVAEAVDEAAVERLAESSSAEVIDDALRASPTSQQLSASSLTPSNVSLTAAMQSVVQVANVLAPTIFVSSVNNVSPSFAPIINLPEPRPQREINLCSEVNLPERAVCVADGKNFTIVLREYYRTGECESEGMTNLVTTVAGRIHRFAETNRLQFDARVDGFASRRPVKGSKCPNAGILRHGRSIEAAVVDGECSHRNLLRESVAIRGCDPRSKAWRDGNVLLSAKRAKGVAELLEEYGGGTIVVQDVIASGSETARVVQDNDNLQSDRAVAIRLRLAGPR